MSIHKSFESQTPYHREMRDAGPETLMQAQMYTPEALKSEGLTRNCYRMVAYGLAVPDLLDRYADRATEISATLEPSQFSVILNAFARAAHRHDKMLKTFSKRMLPRLPHFVPMDFCQISNAYAKLREQEEGLFRRFSSEMPHKLPLFAGYQIAVVANAYARLSVRDDLLFDDLADEIVRRPQELNHVDLLMVTNAFAHFGLKQQRLWFTLADWLQMCYLDFRAQDVATLLNALSSVDFKHDALLRCLLGFLVEPATLKELTPISLGIAFNALARLQWDREPAHLEALANHAVSCLDGLSAHGVTQLMNAAARLPALREHQGLTQGLLARAGALVPECNAQSISLLVNACAKMRTRDVPLLTQVAKSITPRVKEFNAQSLAVTAHGFAKLDIRSEILFYLLAGEMIEKMPLFTGQGLGMALAAYGRLGIKNEKLVQACRKQLRALADELTLQEVNFVEAGLRSLNAMDGTTEAIIRRLRRRLGEEELDDLRTAAAPGREADPWGAEADGLLRRLREEPRHLRAAASGPGAGRASPGAAEAPAAAAAAKPPPDAEDSKESGKAQGDLDLWDLWEKEPTGRREPAADESFFNVGQAARAGGTSDFVPGADTMEATPAPALRDYLARNPRPGRRATVLDGEEAAPSAGRGRRRRRQGGA